MADGTRLSNDTAEALAASIDRRLDEIRVLVSALAILRGQQDAADDRPSQVTGLDPALGSREVAELLGVRPRTVTQWVFRRLLPDPDLVRHGVKLWRRSTIVRWAGDTGRLSSPALRVEYEERWQVPPVPYRQGGRIPAPPTASLGGAVAEVTSMGPADPVGAQGAGGGDA